MNDTALTADDPLAPVRQVWSKDRPIVLVARNSGENGREARRQAINDLLQAADRMAAAGCDLRPGLPSKSDLLELIRTATPIRSKDKNGKSFINRIATIDLRATYGVYVVVSVGTGRKLDDQGTQPFVSHLAEVITRTTPCLLFARRLDRITRRAWALGPVMLNLYELDAFIGDADFGMSRADGIESVLVFFRAQAAEEEARKLPLKSREGMHRETGGSLASGSCTYAVSAPVPPGFMSYRPTVRGILARRVITFDTPSCRPAAGNVSVGLPEVFEPGADGGSTPVDQVANVRWALQRLGQPAWPVRAIAKALAARRFSTEGLRRTYGPAATYTVGYTTDNAYKVLYSIKANLDLYETGVMTLDLGVEDVDPIVITDCFPPDGEPWATPADFHRIRQWLLTTMPPARRSTVLSGLDVVVNGIPCQLIKTRGSERSEDVTLTAVITDNYRNGGQQRSPGVPVVLQPAMIIEPLVDAIARLGDQALTLAPIDSEDDGIIIAELDAARMRLRVLDDERDAIESQLLARSDDGRTLQVSGALLTRLNERYNTIAESEQPDARHQITLLEEQLDSQRRQANTDCAGVATQRLLALIAALRDPCDTSHKDLLHRTIRNLTMTVERHSAHRRVWWTYTITFDVRISTDDGNIDTPVTTTITHGAPFDITAHAQAVLDHLCTEPITWQESDRVEDALLRRHVARILDIPSRRMMLPNITDPRLAHLTARLLADRETLDQIAHDTGETLDLLQHIQHVHRHATRAVWRTRPRPTIAHWYRLGWTGPVNPTRLATVTNATWPSARNLHYQSPHNHHWTLHDDGYQLAPCPHCNSRRRTPAGIPEPVGLVCIDCSTDEAGEHWPQDTYGHLMVVAKS